MTGVSSTYAGTVENDKPAMYWRLGEYAGTLLADASGHDHRALYAANHVHTGALPNDPDAGTGAGVVYYGSSYDLIRAPLAAGMPTGDRTVEAWVWSDNPGARLLSYGDFNVTLEERAIVVSGTRIGLADSDTRRITDARWHQIAVTYKDGTVTAYLDGAPLGSAAKSLSTVNTGELLAARIPAGANVVYDDLAVYAKALDAATIAAHFTASGNAFPSAPEQLTADVSGNAVTASWVAPDVSAPAGQRPIDHYVVEAWQGTTLRGAQAVDAARHTATLSGIPAGATTVHVRAVNGFAAGPDATADATIPGAASTYAGAVTSAAPQLYWRLGERSGTLVADASGHGRSAAYNQAADQRTLPSALTSDADSSVGAGVVYYGSSYDLIRSPLAAGLPTGNRTVEALVWADAAGAALLSYGGFSVVEEDRGLAVGGDQAHAARRRRPQAHRQQVAPHRADLRRHEAHVLPRRRGRRQRARDADQHRHGRPARRAHPGGRERPLRRARGLRQGARRGHDRRPLRALRQPRAAGSPRAQADDRCAHHDQHAPEAERPPGRGSRRSPEGHRPHHQGRQPGLPARPRRRQRRLVGHAAGAADGRAGADRHPGRSGGEHRHGLDHVDREAMPRRTRRWRWTPPTARSRSPSTRPSPAATPTAIR